jgi:Histidine phosphatase superfamily (branch 1)
MQTINQNIIIGMGKQLIAVRHAESTFIADYHSKQDELTNNEVTLSPYEREKVYVEWAVQPQYVDACLSQLGEAQCLQLKLPSQIYHVVYVSPLRRTVQTACLALQKHPSKASLVIKLEPRLKEFMSYQNTLLVSKSALLSFCADMSAQYSLCIDSSFLEPFGEYWFWESHPSKDKAAELLSIVPAESDLSAGFDIEVLRQLKHKAMTVLPGNNETQREMFVRTESFKHQI